MFAIRGNARSRGPRDGSRTRWENRSRARPDGHRSRSHTDPASRGGRGHSRRLARSTAVFSRATAISRVLGLVREMVSAYFFGVSGLINAFTVAIQIPNLVRALVARRRALGRVRARVQRAPREGGEAAGVACRVDAVLADAARSRRRHRRVHPARAAAHAAVRRPRRRLRAHGRTLARPLPDRRPARAVRDHRRDPQHVPPLRAAGARAGGLEPGDHRWARPRRPADRRRERAALPLCGRRRPRDARAAPPADPVAPAARRATDAGHRLARSGSQARARADAAGDADDRARQRQLARRHDLRVAAPRPGARARRDRQGLPAVHASAGHVRRRGDDGALPDARATRRTRRLRRLAARARRGDPSDRVPPRPRRARLDRSREADRRARLPARGVHGRGHRDRGPVSPGVLDRARVQRLAAHSQPQLLRGAVELGADGDRARRGRPQRHSSTPSSTGSASGGSRSRRRR